MKWTRQFALFAMLSIGALGAVACDDEDPPTTPPDPDPPAAPVASAATSGTSVTVSWGAVTGADSYEVDLTTSGETTRTETTTGTSVTFSSLTPGKTYCGVVTAINEAGSANSDAACAELAPEESGLVEVSGDIVANTTWTSDKVYLLTRPVFVGRDCGPDGNDADCVSVDLTIEPGTTVLGATDLSQGIRGAYLVVSRGSRLIADANADRADKNARPNPEDVIVFTSANDPGDRFRGDWGGLVINGRAPTNSGAEAEGEGDSGFYGGPDWMDDSGILRGVRVEFAGDDVTPTDQLNGIALQGVGAGTIFDYVQVAYNVDDGTEPFGGAVSQTHVVLTGIGDDSFDGTDGYKGFIQYGLAQQRADDADQGMELSNSGDTEDASPRTTAVASNVTLVGAREALGSGEISALGGESDHGILLREGAYWKIYNTIAVGFGASGLCVEGTQAGANAAARQGGSTDPDETLAVEGLILWGNVDPADATGDNQFCDGQPFTRAQHRAFFDTEGWNNMRVDPGLPGSAFDIGSLTSPPDFVPAQMPDGYTATPLSNMLTGGLMMPTDGRTLEDTDYAGAVEPGTALEDAWYYGWTIWALDGSDSRPGLSAVAASGR